MNEYCVVVAEAAQARIFTLQEAEVPEFDSGPELVERKTLVNPQKMASEEETWTDTRRGANKEFQAGGQQGGVPHHNYDEHRDDNERLHNQEFAAEVVKAIEEQISGARSPQVVLCAETRMIGYLRPAVEAHLGDNATLKEIPQDLTGFSPRSLHEKLADEGHIPARKRGVRPDGYGEPGSPKQDR